MIEITAPSKAHFDTLAMNFEAFPCTTLIVTQTQTHRENKMNLHLLYRNQGPKRRPRQKKWMHQDKIHTKNNKLIK